MDAGGCDVLHVEDTKAVGADRDLPRDGRPPASVGDGIRRLGLGRVEQ